jgi:hypothetical protein
MGNTSRRGRLVDAEHSILRLPSSVRSPSSRPECRSACSASEPLWRSGGRIIAASPCKDAANIMLGAGGLRWVPASVPERRFPSAHPWRQEGPQWRGMEQYGREDARSPRTRSASCAHHRLGDDSSRPGPLSSELGETGSELRVVRLRASYPSLLPDGPAAVGATSDMDWPHHRVDHWVGSSPSPPRDTASRAFVRLALADSERPRCTPEAPPTEGRPVVMCVD